MGGVLVFELLVHGSSVAQRYFFDKRLASSAVATFTTQLDASLVAAVLGSFSGGLLCFWQAVLRNVTPQCSAFTGQPAIETVSGEGDSLASVAFASPWRSAQDTFAQHHEISPFLLRVVEDSVGHGP